MDEDLTRSIPDAPPPRPAARDAAIAAAIARFDGLPPPSDARAARPRGRVNRGRSWSGAAGALASVALVVAVALPVALRQPDREEVASPIRQSRDVVDPDPPAEIARPDRAADPQPARAAPTSRPGEDVSVTSRASRPDVPATAFDEPTAEAAAPALSAPPPPTSPPPAPASAAELALVPPSAVARRAEPAGEDVVVTGARIQQRFQATKRRGGWNACTVDDPARDIGTCEAAAGSSAGDRDEAAGGALAEGLELAWRGNWRAAAAAFDRAVKHRPRSGLALVNRGSALARVGEWDLAAADLDRAVRLDRSARSFHARAAFRRKRGDMKGAREDEIRAAELDPNYPDPTDL